MEQTKLLSVIFGCLRGGGGKTQKGGVFSMGGGGDYTQRLYTWSAREGTISRGRGGGRNVSMGFGGMFLLIYRGFFAVTMLFQKKKKHDTSLHESIFHFREEINCIIPAEQNGPLSNSSSATSLRKQPPHIGRLSNPPM